jgi:hypothetical protein
LKLAMKTLVCVLPAGVVMPAMKALPLPSTATPAP